MRIVLLLAVCLSGALGRVAISEGDAHSDRRSVLAAQTPAVPGGDPFVGRDRFVSEGCVICHSVKGVGGTVAPPLDWERTADEGDRDAVDFAARMWRGAPAMVALQEALFGYQVDIQGDDLRHVAAFAASPEAQDGMSEALVPDLLKPMILTEPLYEDDLHDRYGGEEWPYPERGYDEQFEDRRYE